MRRLLLLSLLAGCPRKVPDHLQLHPTGDDGAADLVITDAASAIAAIVGKDPLARSPSLPDPARLEPLEGGDALVAFTRGVRSIEQGEGPLARVLQQLEDEWQATAVVALARGYRLRIAENELVGPLETEEAQQGVLGLVTPLSSGAPDPTLPRRPLEWLGEGVEPVRAYAERWVLTGWLASPDIPLQALAGPLAQPQYDDIRETPVGRLVLERAGGTATADPAAGLADLARATRLALTHAAADRDAEQAAWADEKKAAATELGDPDPVAKLLERAEAQLVAASADDRAAGGALLAIGALRWVGRCPHGPCAGLDRVETMAFSARWDPEIARLAALWRVIALKEALDTLEVGRETALYPDAMLDLTDALIGTGAGPLDGRILQNQSPDATAWLTVSRAVGTEGVTDWEGARVAVGEHLAREAGAARALVVDDEGLTALLDRVAARAVP